MAVRNYSNTAQDTTLNGGITDSATTATVTAATGWPAAPFTILINAEVILVGGRSGTSLSSMTRAFDGTTATAHTNGDAVKVVVVAQDFEEAVSTVGGGVETVNTVSASGTTETLDLGDGNVHDVTLSDDCTFTFSGSTASTACSFTLIVRQDGTGGHTRTWPAAVDWPGGSEPSASTAASSVDVYTFVTVDNGTTWLGFQAGAAMA